ncbi:FCD domain-containing protein [Sulfolobus sp. E5-1-F]|uniref:GntR family transcriptional regulator n=1 Tax=Saccharolobus sp. E5-1-F TaxID=2663019 RepID=UPI0012974F29|nr:GntR family transcriptional regulator [Sulfolobus sp. E5-1-F]QGA55498.1 FCD domain-containing protein [Sulfolobus sp. E5-1-F]
MPIDNNHTREKSELIYNMIKDGILKGKYLPGERLSEENLAKEYGVSRNTIRIVLARLEKDGLVMKTSSGKIVAFVDYDEAIQILEVREVLDGYLARLAAKRITDKQLEELERILNEMKRIIEAKEYHKYSQLNEVFHNIIYEASGNMVAVKLIKSLRLRMVRVQYLTSLLPGRSNKSIEEHERILNALRLHDEDEAERMARLHVASVREAIKNNVPLLNLKVKEENSLD